MTGRQEVPAPSISSLGGGARGLFVQQSGFTSGLQDLRSDCLGLDETGFCGVLVCYVDTGITDSLACLMSPKS